MIECLVFGIGKRGEKHHAYADFPDGRMEGPARDTEAEAMADRDRFGRLAMDHLKKVMPDGITTIQKLQ